MKNDLFLSIIEIVGSPVCVSSTDGQRVYDRLVTGAREGRIIVLSFRMVTTLTPTFLNTAIGQLYGEFSAVEIHSMLKLQDIEPPDLEMVKRVIENAKLYFAAAQTV